MWKGGCYSSLGANGSPKRKLEGVKATEEFVLLLEKAARASKSTSNVVDDDDKAVSDDAFHSVVSRATAPLSTQAAQSFLEDCEKDSETISMNVIHAMYTMFQSDKESLAELDKALSSTTLTFTAPPPPTAVETEEQKRFQKRMDRLKLKQEEYKYKKLTRNLDTFVADDVTTKSMTYAASVGLNMIVAPISFGVFMFFFAGQIFTWVLGAQELKPHETDIRRVIAGVVGGVLMLFIEMLLFVIRTHEFDASMRKKNRKNKDISPFGYIKPKEKAK